MPAIRQRLQQVLQVKQPLAAQLQHRVPMLPAIVQQRHQARVPLTVVVLVLQVQAAVRLSLTV